MPRSETALPDLNDHESRAAIRRPTSAGHLRGPTDDLWRTVRQTQTNPWSPTCTSGDHPKCGGKTGCRGSARPRSQSAHQSMGSLGSARSSVDFSAKYRRHLRNRQARWRTSSLTPIPGSCDVRHPLFGQSSLGNGAAIAGLAVRARRASSGLFGDRSGNRGSGWRCDRCASLSGEPTPPGRKDRVWPRCVQAASGIARSMSS